MRTTVKRKSVAVRIALLALIVYAVVSLIQLQLQLDEGQRLLDDVNGRVADQLTLNADLQDQIDNYETYLEQQARKQGMAKPGETVLIEIPKD